MIAPVGKPITTPDVFQLGVLILAGAVLIHYLVVGLFGQLPRSFGVLLTLIYGWFLYAGLIA
jgi:hypothetical protein